MWKNNVIYFIISCFAFFFVTGCSLFHTTKDKEILLETEINRWNHFRMEGIVEINYRELVFRKQFFAVKNPDAFRFDVIDTGLFGFKPTPFFSLYAHTFLYVKQFPDYKLEKSALPASFATLDLKKLVGNTKKIIHTKQVKNDNFILTLNDRMQIKLIKADTFQIDFVYNYMHEVERIEVKDKDKTIAILHIDKIEKGNGKILPLK